MFTPQIPGNWTLLHTILFFPVEKSAVSGMEPSGEPPSPSMTMTPLTDDTDDIRFIS